jgi:deoxyribonuclease-4
MPSRKKQPKSSPPPLLLGAHLSIAGGLHKALYRARDLGCTALQIFTKNAGSWKERHLQPEEIERFTTAARETGISLIAAHGAYLINLASPDRAKRNRSRRALVQELKRASALGIPFVVLHPGAHMGGGPAKAIRRVAETVSQIFAQHPGHGARLLLETTAGQGSTIGYRFEELAEIAACLHGSVPLGFCLDTAHIFAAGYDIRSRPAYEGVMKTFDRIIGLKRLHLLHLNDTPKPLGSRVDRHADIGDGRLGSHAFRLIMRDPRLVRIPKIIETPKGSLGDAGDRRNLERLRALAGADV